MILTGVQSLNTGYGYCILASFNKLLNKQGQTPFHCRTLFYKMNLYHLVILVTYRVSIAIIWISLRIFNIVRDR